MNSFLLKLDIQLNPTISINVSQIKSNLSSLGRFLVVNIQPKIFLFECFSSFCCSINYSEIYIYLLKSFEEAFTLNQTFIRGLVT